MKTKITIKKKNLLDKVKTVTPIYSNTYIKRKKDCLTIIFDKTLTSTQVQKIKDLLENEFNVIDEEVADSEYNKKVGGRGF